MSLEETKQVRYGGPVWVRQGGGWFPAIVTPATPPFGQDAGHLWARFEELPGMGSRPFNLDEVELRDPARLGTDRPS
jgi:hypothetical protein